MSNHTGSAGVKRRDFLKVLGATSAAGATVGCSSERVERLIPYLVHPDNTVPGVSNYYATTCRECAAACGIIAEVRDGRAIKLEGNPEHPLNRGLLCARGQSALQGLYNPDRFRQPQVREGDRLVPTTWENAIQLLGQRLSQARGTTAANAVFINQAESGSFPAFLDQWLTAFGMPPHVAYDADLHLPTIEANRQSFGVAWPTIDFTVAQLIVSIGADFLDTWGAVVPQQLSWANARAQLDGAPRMVYIGPRRSLTGLNADDWIPCRPGFELRIANALQAAIGGGAGESLAVVAEAAGVPAGALERLAREMATARPAVVLAGTSGPDATQVSLAANALSQALGAVGTVLRPDIPLVAFDRVASYSDVRAITERMVQGNVSMLFVRGANPAFTTPRTIGFREAMAQVPFKVSFSSYPDETAMECDLILPDHHALESWGDAQPLPNVLSLQQPTMNPVFDTRPTADVLISLAVADPAVASGYPQPTYGEWLRARLGEVPGISEAFARGVTTGSVLTGPTPVRAPAAPVPAPAAAEGDFYLMVYPSALLGTGAGANKPWLQELADPVTKIAWQSWVEIHPLTAERLEIANGDMLNVATSVGQVVAPAYIYLGIHPDTVALALGRGHWAYGRYAENIGINPLDLLTPVEDQGSGALALSSSRAAISKTGTHVELVTTEGSARQHGRGIAQAVLASQLVGTPSTPVVGGETTAGQTPIQGPGVGGGELNEGVGPGDARVLPDSLAGPTAPGVVGPAVAAQAEAAGHDIPGLPSHEFLPGLRAPVAGDAQGRYLDPDANDRGMYDPDHWSGMARKRWAMTIDLARCTGCSACVVACYSENNIPTVGAPWQGRATSPTTWDETPGANIVKGREMTWIRLERYFEGGYDGSHEFESRFVPMLCQHCGNAPCEPVCPVYATYHSPDGLNVQVYNRCVGTRYCSNNCPYKVRYFNWFGYGEPERRQYAFPEPLNWQLNPDVTVRGKGVMEKCTFCVQRIREAENRAALEGRPVAPDEFTVACAQACPSKAITFGDAADPGWSVSKLATDQRAYHVFNELNTYTAVVYLKKVNHPAPGAPATT